MRFMEGWQGMEGQLDKVDKVCENGRVQKVVDRL